MSTGKRWEDLTAEERNALVAEKAAGWTNVRIVSSVNEARWFPGEAVGTPPDMERRARSVVVGGAGEYPVPRYTTDIAAAWEVVERMEAAGWIYEARSVPESDRHRWSFRRDAAPHEGVADQPAQAICLAALRACEMDV